MKRTIAGKDYKFKEEEIPIEKLRFWKDNPRIHAEMYSPYGGGVPKLKGPELQQKIYNKLKGLEEKEHNHVRELRDRIEKAGLPEPLIVRKNKQNYSYDVLEGNRRLAACKMILERAKRDKEEKLIKRFSSLSCEVVPEDFSESHIFSLLGVLHISGKLKWEPFAKASYVKRRVEAVQEEGKSENEALEIVGQEIGETKSEIETLVANINLMKYAKEKKTTKYSFYNVLNRTRETRKALENDGYKKRWVISIGNWGDKATEFRAAVKVVVKDQKALKKFQDGKLGLEDAAQQAEASGSTDVIYRRVKKFRNSMVNAKTHIRKLDDTDQLFKKLKFEFRHLQTLTNDIVRTLSK